MHQSCRKNVLRITFGSWIPPAIVSSESVDRQVRGDPYSSEASQELLLKPTNIPNPNKNEDHERERNAYSDMPEWLQEFRESCG